MVASSGDNFGTGWTAVSVAAGVTDVQVVAATPNLRFGGFAASEEAGAEASFKLHHGTAGTDPVLLPRVGFVANETVREMPPPGPGIECPNGIFLDRTGNIALVVYVKS